MATEIHHQNVLSTLNYRMVVTTILFADQTLAAAAHFPAVKCGRGLLDHANHSLERLKYGGVPWELPSTIGMEDFMEDTIEV